MRVEFKLKFRDLYMYNLMHQLSSITIHLFIAFVPFVFALFAGEGESVLVTTMNAVVVYFASWLLHFLFLFVFLATSDKRTMLAAKVLELHEDALFEESRFNKSYHYWQGILKAVRRPGFMAIYTSGLAAHVIPNRAFSTTADRTQFWSVLNSRLNISRRTHQ